jgi:hypothetical protein
MALHSFPLDVQLWQQNVSQGSHDEAARRVTISSQSCGTFRAKQNSRGTVSISTCVIRRKVGMWNFSRIRELK